MGGVSGRANAASISDLQLGDIVSADFDRDGSMDHTMVVTVKTGSYIKLSYHTQGDPGKLDVPFVNLTKNAYYYGWHITGTD